jgi:IrrE N-terminal-like domain
MSTLVPAVAPLSRRQIEAEALALTQEFCPDRLKEPGPFPVRLFFEWLEDRFSLDVGVEELSAGVEGITWPDGRVIVSEPTYRGMVAGDGRSRFTVVHECYHGIRHSRQLRAALVHTGALVLHRRPSLPPYRDPEWQANAFAGAILMPTEMVQRVVASRRAGVRGVEFAIAGEFQVSVRAAEVRLEVLKNLIALPR